MSSTGFCENQRIWPLCGYCWPRIPQESGALLLYTGCQRSAISPRFGEAVVVCSIGRKESFHCSPSCFCSVLISALSSFSVSLCASLSLGSMSSLFPESPRVCACMRACVCVFIYSIMGCFFSSVLVIAVKETVAAQLILSLCPRSVGEVFFYPLLQLIICLAYATVIISPASVKPMSFLF